VPAIAEGFVEFERELSLIAVRGAANPLVFYPLTENKHRDGILVESLAPFENPVLQRTAAGWLEQIMSAFDYRGVLTVEFFLATSGLIANEMAPRVHNSGHWTIEGAETSQFENHLRAILGWPLGDTAPRGHAAMLNMLGQLAEKQRVLAIPGAHFHDYGKEPRPARKLGHCTLVDERRERLLTRLPALRGVVGAPD
jgi:5-(carboxyamino)imidazole ribonucleotide synthase